VINPDVKIAGKTWILPDGRKKSHLECFFVCFCAQQSHGSELPLIKPGAVFQRTSKQGKPTSGVEKRFPA